MVSADNIILNGSAKYICGDIFVCALI